MNLDEFIESIRELKSTCPMTVIVLPPHTKGLPDGSYNLELLLECIARNLEGNRPACRTRRIK